eukprot:TRINITY_DN582_c0_g1_i1.p1 TRINITY_DN582_c0_g1~~TRINITY_DN582_c0_g1_i1.p1  ORF type:complete len:2479 (-),score=648.89 TRINITY_DN582_c0_g1_i1:1460-8896(-)
MANPGAGSKFVSVNLNKSYGQPPSSSANAGRIRPAHHGGGGGMVVLSRQRSSVSGSTKAGPRLSVPRPLNLPSLRKEHERFDQSTALGSSSGARSGGSGLGNASSVAGWTRPGLSATLLEKGGNGDHTVGRLGSDNQRVSSPGDGGVRGGGGIYMPPAARLGSVGQHQDMGSARDAVSVEKAVVLRGEDFPTLHATLPSVSAQKQKDVLHPKQKPSEGVLQEHSMSSELRLQLHMRPQMHSSRLVVGSHSNENEVKSNTSSGLNGKEQSQKLDRYLPGPLPLVRLRHTSDWEDDERDTGHGFPNRDRDHGLTRNASVQDRDFDIPRGGLPRTLVRDQSDGRGLRDAEHIKVSSGEVLRGDPYRRELTTPIREVGNGSSWRVSPSVVKDGFSSREIRISRNGMGTRSFSPSRELAKDSKYSESTYRDSGGNGFRSTGSVAQDSRNAKRDSGCGASGHNGNRPAEAFNSRGAEQNPRSRYGDLSNRYKGDLFQSSSMAKASLSSGTKGLPLNDPILSFGREKRLFSSSAKPYTEDAFDTRDPFSGGLIGDAKIFKRKKDILKQTDFHDPVRESFEAELERVQKMQEQERQRVAEEQARALELARREEEERQRLAREEEERRRRLEEEAREAAWRAEQERLDALKRAEEQKMAREEEKRRVLLEEERRKEAARKKLLELEARIAKRKAEADKDDKFSTIVGNERMPGMLRGRDGPRAANVGDWEDGERMVERITSSASSDSSSLNRSAETGSRPHSSRDGNSVILDGGKHSNFWSRDSFESGSNSSFLPQQDPENGYISRRDGLGGGRVYPRKDFYGGPGVMSSRTSTKGGMPEIPVFDDYPHLRGQRWNFGGDGDHYNRNAELDPEFPDNSMDRFGDIGWGHGPPRGNLNAPYADRLFQNTDIDALSSFGRSRHSMRQPRVLPPPSLPAMHRSAFRDESEYPSSSVFLNEESKFVHNTRRNEHILQAGYETSYHDRAEQSGIMDAAERNGIPNEQGDEKHPPGCDSQSSLSVSSPPDSPTHLSHDDLDDSGELAVIPAADDCKQRASSDSEYVASASEGITNVMASSLVSSGEDENWAIETNEELQEQEEYDEEEDTYHEEDEVREGADENLDEAQEFGGLHSKEQTPHVKVGQMVLGFDEGVEVEMPDGDELENAANNAGKAIETQAVSAGIVTVGLVGNGQGLQAEIGGSEGSIDSSSKMIDEAEKSLQDLPHQSPVASPTYLLDNVEVPSSSGMPDQQAVASAMNSSVLSQTIQMVLPAASTVLSQSEVPPVKLQFGLFSGPSLIPSPVPAIQIGSIQMPLLHPQVGRPITQLHPSQPPFFQFGQLRYTSPMSQGILPLAAPQTLTFAQPAVSAHYSLNENPGVSLINQVASSSSAPSPLLNEVVASVQTSQQNTCAEQKTLFIADSSGGEVLLPQNPADGSLFVEKNNLSSSVSQVENQSQHDKTAEKNFRSMSGNRDTHGQKHIESTQSQIFSNERDLGGSKAPGAAPGSKGKRFIYAVRNTGSRPSVPESEASHVASSGFQRRPRRNVRRTEFKVRENVDRRQSEGFVSSNYSRVDEKSNLNGRAPGIASKGGNKKDTMLTKSTKPLVDSQTFLTSGSSSRIVDTGSKMSKTLGKDAPSKRLINARETSHSGEGRLQANVVSEDVDAPLQSGIVRVFKQPGIEAPSDEDDFIEVRSKRQMLNDRREQREKEIKAKSRVIKAPRKPRSVSQSTTISANLNKTTSLSGEVVSGVQSEHMVSDRWASTNDEVSTGFATGMASPPLPPIGTPATSTDAVTERRSLATKSGNTSSLPVSSGGTNLVPVLPFENKNAALDNVITPFGSWASVCINQQVMALTQTQLDEAMKARFDTHVAPTGDHSGSALELGKPSTSILTQDKSFSSTASPLNSLLAGEKIQFGAVTSPTILPPSSLPVSSSVGPPGSCRPDVSIDCNLSASGAEHAIIFDKDEHPDPSCVQLEDPEAEAEAAASAVAVAAISSDELVGNELGGSSVSVSDAKSFGGADISGLPSGCGVVGDQKLPSPSRGEESLTVALPADLSVETPPLSLWPPLSSPHNSSGPMLSHFPGAPPHFPCYEMNPMLGGPFFAFGPHDESGGTQPQSQKSGTAAAGSVGAWQPCHSGVDSFYGPSAGFTGPFINPGGIPGVQGPPHMVVYNHFAPVGQFGQVGLSFMGTTYIPSGKQPDWKHTPVSSAVGISEGDIHNLNNSSGQRNPSSMPASIQHLAPGSPLLQMASPLAMFDLSQFQSSADVPVQAHWPHVPTSPLHSVLPSMPPLQHQVEGRLPSQFSHGLSVDTPNLKSFQESRSSTSADSGRAFPQASGSTTQFPGEGLIEPSSASSSRIQISRPTSFSSINGNGKAESNTKSRGTASDASQGGIVTISSSGACSSTASMSSAASMTPANQQVNSSASHYPNPIGHTEQRGAGVSQKIGSGGEWHRRVGFPGRNQTVGSDKNFGSSKVKQIYVAKPATSVPTTTA